MKKSYNVQTYVDVKIFAGVARHLIRKGLLEFNNNSEVLRTVLQMVYGAFMKEDLEPFESGAEALAFLKNSGFSTRQVGYMKDRGLQEELSVTGLIETAKEDKELESELERILNEMKGK